MANSKFKSSYISSKNKRHIQVRMTDDTFNINSSTSWTEVPMSGTIDKKDKGFDVSGNGIVAKFTDWVEMSASLYQVTGAARTNVEICFAINGTERAVIGASAYIRNTSNHNHASAHVEDGFFVEAGDIITLKSRQEANAGTVTSPNGSSIMKAWSTPVAIERGPAGTYNESFETDLGQWTNDGSADWIRYNSATPSSGTGTDISGVTGSYFVYCELSNGAEVETFILKTSYFHFIRSVSFDYQLEGSDCGTFVFEYKNKSGTWVQKFSITGSQGSSWHTVNIDLSGETDIDDCSEIRFKYNGANGYQADLLLDNVTVISV